MTDERYRQLMESDTIPLSQEEVDAHWHFCPEWDGLLISPSMMEFEFCLCFDGDDTCDGK